MAATVEKQMVAAELEFRPFHAETELNQQRELFLDAFPETIGTSQASKEHYRWKFQNFPDSPPAYEYGAYFEGKMVGYYAALPYRYRIDGVDLKAAMVCDVMTHSSMRGKGVFTKLGAYALEQMALEGLDIAFGYPIRPEVIPGHLKVGWKVSGRLPLQVKILGVKAALQSHRYRFLSPLIDIGCSLYGSLFSPRRWNREQAGFSIQHFSVEEFLQSAVGQEFVTRLERCRGNSLCKTAPFLGWRYGAPGVRYQVVGALRNGIIEAAAFTRVVELKEIPTLAILDFVTGDTGSRETASQATSVLLSAVEALAKKERVQMIAMMIPASRAKRLKLFWAGYLRSPFVFQLITRNLSAKAATLSEMSIESFFPMWVDSDDL